jgi:hypothetical protein
LIARFRSCSRLTGSRGDPCANVVGHTLSRIRNRRTTGRVVAKIQQRLEALDHADLDIAEHCACLRLHPYDELDVALDPILQLLVVLLAEREVRRPLGLRSAPFHDRYPKSETPLR